MAKLTLQQTLDKSLKTAKQYVDTELAKKANSSHTHAAITMNNCSNKDLNTIKTAGYYYGYTGMTNAAVQAISVLEVIVYSPDWVVQRQTVINATGTTYERHYHSGNTWSAWKKLYDANNKPTLADLGHGSHLALGETSSTAYRGDRGKIAYDHSQAAHAPSNAQKNSDITKAEIEAKLTGAITSHTHNYAPSSHNHTTINRTCITTPIYNPEKGILIDFNTNVKSGIMAIIKIYGNSYSSNPPIEAIYQFYDYASGDLMQYTGSAISGPAITLKVYKVDGKLKAWFQQPSTFCTFKVEVAYGNNSSTPNITLTNAAEPTTNITQTITITPNRVYSAAYKPTPADIGAAASSHNHTSLTGITSLAFGGIDGSDTISITTSASSATSYMDFNMTDDANSDMWRWRFSAWDSTASAMAATFNAMTLMATSTTKAKLAVNGSITADSFNGLNFWTGTQSQYNSLSSKSATTVYFITG